METQIELLHKYGIEHPYSNLQNKVIGYQFGQSIDVRDPYTMKKDKKPLKPYMVNNSVITFEKEKIILDQNDKLLKSQLEGYVVKSISSKGLPVFSDKDEHAVDALNLCLLVIDQKYGTLFKDVVSSKVLPFSELKRREPNMQRDKFYNKPAGNNKIIAMSAKGLQHKNIIKKRTSLFEREQTEQRINHRRRSRINQQILQRRVF